LAKAARAANVLDGYARFSLFEQSDDLLVGKSCGPHTRHSPKLADFVPSIWYGSEGAGQFLRNICAEYANWRIEYWQKIKRI
jgi:hypothetical protein